MAKDSWGWSEEREFVENLVNQRFNFLLVLFGFIITAATQVKTVVQLQILLWLGVLTVVPVSITIAAASFALQGIIEELYKLPTHPVTRSHSGFAFLQIRWVIGYFVPAVCSIAMLAGAVLTSAGQLWCR